MSFINDIVTNSIEAQTIKVMDSLDVPSITIGGAVFNGDVSGGVTLPYLEGNYVKKTDASVLNDISSTVSQVVTSKDINVPNVSTGNVNASNVYTSMNNVQDASAVNLLYATTNFPVKSSVYSRAQSDLITNGKLDVGSFNAFQATNAQAIATKQDLGVGYTKAQSDSLVSGKVDASTFGNYQSTVGQQLAGKLNTGDAYTTSQVDNLVSGKLPVSYGTTNDQAVAGKVSQFAFDTYVAGNSTNLSGKANTADVYTIPQTDSLLANKIDNSYFQTYASAQSNALNTKVPQTAFDGFQTSNTTALAGKVSSTDFGNYQMANTAALNTKYNVSDFNTFNTANNTALGNKLNTSDFTSYQSSNNSNVASKVSQSDFNSNVSSTNAAIALKANSTDVYTKTQVDGKDAFIQNALDAYKTSNDTSVASKAPQSTTYTKSEVDNIATGSVLAGTGLTKSGSTLSVNPSQTQVTTLGTLSTLNVSGGVTAGSVAMTTGTISTAPSSSGDIVNKSYTDSQVNTKWNTPSNATNLSAIDQNLSTTSIATFPAVTLSSVNAINLSSTGTVQTILFANSAGDVKWRCPSGTTGTYYIGADQNNFLQLGVNNTGLMNVAYAQGCNISTTTASTSTTTGALRVAGGVGIAGNLNIGGSTVFSNTVTVPTPVNGTDATTKTYVDSSISTSNASILAGTGLTRTGNTFSINQNQNQITGLGALGSLTVLGTTSLQSVSTGDIVATTLTFSDSIFSSLGSTRVIKQDSNSDLSIRNAIPNVGSIYIGNNQNNAVRIGTGSTSVCNIDSAGGMNVAGNVTMAGTLICASTVRGSSITSNSDFIGGSSGFTIKPSGVTTGLVVFGSGTAAATNTTDATAISNAGFTCYGGIGVAKSAYIGGDLNIMGQTIHTGNAIFNSGITNKKLTISQPTSVGGTGNDIVFQSSETTDSTPYYRFLSQNGNLKFAIPSGNSIGNAVFNGGLTTTGLNIQTQGTTVDETAAFLSGIRTQKSSTNIESMLFYNSSTYQDSTKPGHFTFSSNSQYGFPQYFVLDMDKNQATFTGALTSSNYSAQGLTNGTSQAGTTPTKVVDLNWWSKKNRLVDCYINYQTSAVSGSQSGNLTFTLPTACNYTAAITNATVIRNGTPTACTLQFTSGSSTVTLQTPTGGLGALQATTPAATDNWNLIFSYGSAT